MFENWIDLYYFIIIPIQYAIIGVVLAWVMYQDIQPKALILKKQNEAYYRLATINVKKTQDTFIYNKEVYVIDWSKIAYHTQTYWHHVPRLFYLEHILSPLDIHSNVEPKSQEKIMRKLYMLAKEQVVKQLVKASGSTLGGWGLIIVFILISIGLGFGIGWITHSMIGTPTPQTGA